MTNKSKASARTLEPIVVPLPSDNIYGGCGHLGRPFRVDRPLSAGVILRMKATPEERARANNFRDLLRDLSPDFDAACRNVAVQNSCDEAAISDAQIDALIGPILKEKGYDIHELGLLRQKSRSVRRVQARRPSVVNLDLTGPYEELRKLQATLEWIVRSESLSKDAAYYVEFAYRAAVFAPLQTWEKMVGEDERHRLGVPMRRAYKNLTAVAGTDSEFRQCRIIHFLSRDQAASNAFPKLQHSSAKKLLGTGNSPLVIVGNSPLVIVEGDTVVAALPRDEGNRVTSATVAVEMGQNEKKQLTECQILPDMNAIMAQAEGTRAVQTTQLS